MSAFKMEETSDVWAASFDDPLANLNSFPGSLALMNVDGRSGVKLLAIHLVKDNDGKPLSSKLMAWRSNTRIETVDLPGVASGIAACNLSSGEGSLAATAVAVDDAVLIFKNLKPYYRFTLPSLPASQEESEVWSDILARRKQTSNLEVFKERLHDIRSSTAFLSARSFKFLALREPELSKFVESVADTPLTYNTNIVCMTTMYENTAESDAPQCLVLGTELGEVIILSPKNFAVLDTIRLPACPVLFSIQGSFKIDYRILVACRDGSVYTIKKGIVSDVVIGLSSHAVGVERMNKVLYVGTMDDNLSCYSTKGARLWSLPMPASINTMAVLSYKPRNIKALMVALDNGEVRLYQDRILVNVIKQEDPIVALIFGHYSNHDGVLVMASRQGPLRFKMLRRAADLSGKDVSAGPPPEQSIPIPVPPKTKLYLEQTKRERDNAVAMHRNFQRDLFRVRLATARNYVKALESSLVPMVTNVHYSIQASANVRGIGPLFVIDVDVRNSGAEALSQTFLQIVANNAIYQVSKNVIPCGFLVPNVLYKYTFRLKCLSQEAISQPVHFSVCKSDGTALIAVKVDMPVAEFVE